MTATNAIREQLSLAGAWRLAFDPGETGLANGWVSGSWPEAQADTVQVPAPWDTSHPEARGVGFYRREFSLPGSWGDRVVLLHFVGAAYRAEAWVNGRYAGSHEGAYTPFYFDVTPLVHAGANNELIVRVAGLARSRPVDGQLLVQAPASKQSWYYEYGGLWGDVYLEARPWVAIEALRISPHLKRESAQLEVSLMNRSSAAQVGEIGLRVYRPDGRLAAERAEPVAAPPGLSRLTFPIALPGPWPWHPDTPQRYQLVAAWSTAGGQVDRLVAAFGLRDFTVHNGQFFLNGRPIFLRGVLLQPNYPVTLIAPPDRDLMVRELALVKDAGFNLVRTHLRPAPPGYLDLADELGLLIYAETSLAWIKDSPRLLDHGRREVQALIERDFNHPSVVFWGLLNENRPVAALAAEALVRFARSLDSTRVIVDNSGGTMAIDQDFGWVDRATVVPDREVARQRILDLHLYLGGIVPSPIYDWLQTLGSGASSAVLAAQDFGSPAMLEEFDREQRSYTGQVFVSELGCGGMSDLEDTVARFGEQAGLRDAQEMRALRDSLQVGFAARHLDAIFGDLRGLAQAAQELQAAGNACQIEALLANPRISGYVITQLNDVAWEFHAGLLDLWRNPKPAYYASRRLNQPHVLILHSAVAAVTTGDPIQLALTLVNQAALPASAQVELSRLDPGGAESALSRFAAPAGEGIHPLGNVEVGEVETAGTYVVRARLVVDGQVRAETSQPIHALSPTAWPAGLPAFRWVGERPPLADTASVRDPALIVAARPRTLLEDDWQDLLGRVGAGATAVIGPLHKRDELARRHLARRGIELQLHLGIGNWMGCYHWVPDSALFAGLPAGGLAGAAYVDVLPWYGLTELGGEVLAGSLRNTQSRLEPPRAVWYSDVEAVACGAGEIIFCQYRVFDQPAGHPLARRFAANLLRLASERQQQRMARKDRTVGG